MNKHLLRLLYLTRKNQALTLTTANIKDVLNRIPCDEEDFFRADPAELHVIREIQEYPIDMELEHEEEPKGDLDIFDNKNMVSIFRKVEEFATELNYLPIQEATIYLQQLQPHEITEHKESLTQIRKIVSDTLKEEELNDYAIQEI